MNPVLPYIVDGAALIIPAFAILRYGWPGIPVGFLAGWLLPLLSSHIRGPGQETVEADFYWTYFGWMIALGYCLVLWAVRGLFLLVLVLWRRRMQGEHDTTA